jgi:hypothetical protein
LSVGDNEGATMPVLDPGAARRLGEDGIGVHEKIGLRVALEGQQEAGKVKKRRSG